ncbi:stalk domain-containing protein [Paenibacillus pseudetheri]|uniref:stalk domain-containing protein n=1 Tax=Paenibacillus pseudetheri TaxID=2897682 RepID=UPI001F2382C4|nr:stalk domain-containing protein [Paenibacillus pseudetheri]
MLKTIKPLPSFTVIYGNMKLKELSILKKAIIGLVAGMLIGSAGMAAAATTQTVQAALAKFTFSVDGQKQTLKNDPLVYKGTTYLPVREVAEMTGYGLEYDNTKKSIDLKSKGGTVVKNDQLTSTAYTIKGRQLVELLAKKYPDIAKQSSMAIALTQDGELRFGDQSFKLSSDANSNIDITPLIDAGIISQDDVQ